MKNLQEKLEVIRVYDGVTNWFTPAYLTSLDWLHPVAMKVKDELIKISRVEPMSLNLVIDTCMLESKIRTACWKKPNSNGEYTDLFNAVYEGIVFINQYKNK